MKQIKITQSNQADKIKFLPFNRSFKVRQDLVAKMNLYGFTVPVILIETDLISGKMETFVADGQHRFITARFLSIPIVAELLPLKFKEVSEIVSFVASLNSTHKSWEVQDYVDAYAYLGYKEYVTLNKVTKASPYSVSTISSLLNGYRSRGTTAEGVKEGIFVCRLLEETNKTLEFAAKLSKIGKLSARMLVALHYVYHTSKNFNEELFYKKYKEQYNCIKELKLDDYTDIFSSWILFS